MSVAESMGKICTFCSVYVWKFRRAVTSSWTKAMAWPARSRSFSCKDSYKIIVFDMDLFKYEKCPVWIQKIIISNFFLVIIS